jgi:ribonuclease Z
MSMRVVFLGTGAAVPTTKRSLPAVLMQRGNEQFLFDCGEAVQRQMIHAKVGLHKNIRIFLTHMHGDHVLGLPGLLQTMALMDRTKPVAVYAPPGLAHFLECMQETLQFQLTFEVQVFEVTGTGVICNEEEYSVAATPSKHSVTSFAYAFMEKPRAGKFFPEKAKAQGVPKGEAWGMLQHGKEYVLPNNGRVIKPADVSGPPRQGRKIVYTGDTRPFESFASFAQDADLVIHEATFDDLLIERAMADGHSTPSEAATQAKNAHAKSLVLTHISARYTDTKLLEEQAKIIFPHTVVAEDFLEIKLPMIE